MPVRITSAGVLGVDAHPIDVEVDIAGGVFGYETVGLPDTAVRESKQRVKASIRNAGFEFPRERVIVNLSPADLRKEGTAFDLPIALGILGASRQVRGLELGDTLIVGELGLAGQVRPVRGVLSMVHAARARGIPRVVVPDANAPEAAAVGGVAVVAATSLTEAVEVLAGHRPAREVTPASVTLGRDPRYEVDLRFVRGQALGREAVEIAAAGGHALLMSGPPGAGKTLLARCLHGLLPDLSDSERLEISRIYSVAGLLPRGELIARRPFRAPHHTATAAAVVGGGPGMPRPGEVSLSHRGVLFLDEFPEFARNVREVLRQPMESGEVVIARARQTLRFPARFQLVATMNPCPCGHADSTTGRRCTCHGAAVARYQERISGPLRDRFDLHVQCDAVSRDELLGGPAAESTAQVRERVEAARARQRERLAHTPFKCNADIAGKVLEDLCRLDAPTRRLVADVMERAGLSARGFHRAARVARTLADLDGSHEVQRGHFAKALIYRGTHYEVQRAG